MGPTTFGIFDAFPDEQGRQAHLSGKVAQALMANASELLSALDPFGPRCLHCGDERRGCARFDAIGREATILLECNDGRALQIGPRTVFVEALSPPPRLLVFVAGDDARPFAELAVQVGFDVTVVDHRPAYLTPERFPAPVLLSVYGDVLAPPTLYSRSLFPELLAHRGEALEMAWPRTLDDLDVPEDVPRVREQLKGY
jgi:xanthine/CO dehydrogenase XdhC/CoxF family maturation factor